MKRSKRSVEVRVPLTKKEKEEIAAAARKNHLTMSEYIRRRVLGLAEGQMQLRPIVPQLNREAYLELGKLKEKSYDLGDSQSVKELTQKLDQIMLILMGQKKRDCQAGERERL